MLDTGGGVTEHAPDPCCFSCEQLGPRSIVFGEVDRSTMPPGTTNRVGLDIGFGRGGLSVVGFVSHQLIRKLLEDEQLRLSQMVTNEDMR